MWQSVIQYRVILKSVFDKAVQRCWSLRLLTDTVYRSAPLWQACMQVAANFVAPGDPNAMR